jgi:hypothetical protein
VSASTAGALTTTCAEDRSRRRVTCVANACSRAALDRGTSCSRCQRPVLARQAGDPQGIEGNRRGLQDAKDRNRSPGTLRLKYGLRQLIAKQAERRCRWDPSRECVESREGLERARERFARLVLRPGERRGTGPAAPRQELSPLTNPFAGCDRARQVDDPRRVAQPLCRGRVRPPKARYRVGEGDFATTLLDPGPLEPCPHGPRPGAIRRSEERGRCCAIEGTVRERQPPHRGGHDRIVRKRQSKRDVVGTRDAFVAGELQLRTQDVLCQRDDLFAARAESVHRNADRGARLREGPLPGPTHGVNDLVARRGGNDANDLSRPLRIAGLEDLHSGIPQHGNEPRLLGRKLEEARKNDSAASTRATRAQRRCQRVGQQSMVDDIPLGQLAQVAFGTARESIDVGPGRGRGSVAPCTPAWPACAPAVNELPGPGAEIRDSAIAEGRFGYCRIFRDDALPQVPRFHRGRQPADRHLRIDGLAPKGRQPQGPRHGRRRRP